MPTPQEAGTTPLGVEEATDGRMPLTEWIARDGVRWLKLKLAGRDPEADARRIRDVHRVATAALADRLDLPERSLGMSGDLAAAVRAGTTMIRVGTALFGPRPAAGGSRNVRPDLRD